MERRVEHYFELYSRQNECLSVMEDLEIEPTREELSKAIDSVASAKFSGVAGIRPDLIRHCKTNILLPLHEVLY